MFNKEQEFAKLLEESKEIFVYLLRQTNKNELNLTEVEQEMIYNWIGEFALLATISNRDIDNKTVH